MSWLADLLTPARMAAALLLGVLGLMDLVTVWYAWAFFGVQALPLWLAAWLLRGLITLDAAWGVWRERAVSMLTGGVLLAIVWALAHPPLRNWTGNDDLRASVVLPGLVALLLTAVGAWARRAAASPGEGEDRAPHDLALGEATRPDAR